MKRLDYVKRLKEAQDVNTSPETLRKLWRDPEWTIRMGVAGNSNSPEDVLSEASRSNNRSIRLLAAGNTSNSRYNLRKLADDEDADIVRTAKHNLQNH